MNGLVSKANCGQVQEAYAEVVHTFVLNISLFSYTVYLLDLRLGISVSPFAFTFPETSHTFCWLYKLLPGLCSFLNFIIFSSQLARSSITRVSTAALVFSHLCGVFFHWRWQQVASSCCPTSLWQSAGSDSVGTTWYRNSTIADNPKQCETTLPLLQLNRKN